MNKNINNYISSLESIKIVPENKVCKLFINGKPFLTHSKNQVQIPNSIFKKELENELLSYKKNKTHNLLVLSLLIKLADNKKINSEELINDFLNYLETDLLFYYVTTPTNLAKVQRENWGKMIQAFDDIFKTSWETTSEIQSLKQDQKNITIIRNYLNKKQPIDVFVMHSILKKTGSSILTILSTLKLFNHNQIWEAAYLEELWYNKFQYNDTLRSIELQEKKVELDVYLRLLDSLS
jgi:chaperone required for assembly of F1-ATPase